MTYLDNAATSWPKPEVVVDAMSHFLREVGANPGRAAHRRANESGRIVYEAREAIATLFNAPDPMRVLFSANVTQALNLAIKGLLEPGDHVVTSAIEHNAVMRPLRALEEQGVRLTVVRCSAQGCLNPVDLRAAIRDDTRLIVLNYASNVVGTLQPVAEVGRIAQRHGVPLLVDAAQAAGALPIDMQAEGIDLLAFTGHKGLYGPMGTGGLVVAPDFDLDRLRPLLQGGTGSRSEQEVQPTFAPDKYESGTLNVVGLAGLLAGVRWVQAQGVDALHGREVALTQRLIEGLLRTEGCEVYGPLDAEVQTATVSFNLRGLDCGEVGLRLDQEYGIMCRVGLHCSPAAHRTIGTFPNGTVRFGMGAMNTLEDVELALDAVQALAGESS